MLQYNKNKVKNNYTFKVERSTLLANPTSVTWSQRNVPNLSWNQSINQSINQSNHSQKWPVVYKIKLQLKP